MDWQIILALVVIIPIVLIPLVLVWYLNIGGIFAYVKEARARRALEKEGIKVTARSK